MSEAMQQQRQVSAKNLQGIAESKIIVEIKTV